MFGVRGVNGDLILEPKLTSAHFDPEGVAQIRCCSAGCDLLVRYHNPQRLAWGEYRIGSIRSAGRELPNPIAAGTLPANTLVTLDVTLVPAT